MYCSGQSPEIAQGSLKRRGAPSPSDGSSSDKVCTLEASVHVLRVQSAKKAPKVAEVEWFT